MPTRGQDLVNRRYEALNGHDGDALARYYSEDCAVIAAGELRAREAFGPSPRCTGTHSPI